MVSRGEINQLGLRPETFEEYWGGSSTPEYAVRFDRATAQIFFTRRGKAHKPVNLKEGAQDAHTLVFHFMQLGDSIPATLQIVGNTRAREYDLATTTKRMRIGDETVLARQIRMTESEKTIVLEYAPHAQPPIIVLDSGRAQFARR